MNQLPQYGRASRQSGVTLIEVLIAVVVLAVGLLGIAGLQASALTNNAVSYQYTQVATLAQSLVERMQANRSAVIDPSQPYALPVGNTPNPPVNCSTSYCTPAQTAQFDLGVWYQAISPTYASSPPSNVPTGLMGLLPGGTASVACIGTTCTTTSSWLITIYWNSDRSSTRNGTGCNAASSSDLNCYSLVYRP